MDLNKDQQVAYNALFDFITKDTDNQMFLLSGYAGTGKSYTVTKLVKTLIEFEGGYMICMSAPTHKAVKVLKKFSTMGSRVQFATIHSLLGLQEDIDHNGKVSFKKAFQTDEEPRISAFDVVIIDEASMLNDEIFDHLLEFKNKIKFIFSGDAAQLPPIGKESAIPFNAAMRAKYKIGIAQLSNIVRQASGNPILKYATELRKDQKWGNVSAVPEVLDNGTGLEVISKHDANTIMDRLRLIFCCEEFKHNADHAKVLAWRNVTVNNINREIRRLIYKQQDLPNILAGDMLVMDKPVLENGPGKGAKVILHTSDEVTVIEFEKKGDVINFYKLDDRKNAVPDHTFIYFYNTLVEYEELDGSKRKLTIRIVHDDSTANYDAMLDYNKKAALECREFNKRKELWKAYYNIQKQFAQVKYNYAITSHKAQGSTYTNCMAFEWDIEANFKQQERNQLKYVAATRPSKNLIIVK